MFKRLRLPLILLLCAAAPASASAAGWSTVHLPRRVGLSTVSCLSSRWCLARGTRGNRQVVGHWNGRRWTVSPRVPAPRGGVIDALECRSTSSCFAVGELFPHQFTPINPLIERFNGHRWSWATAPKPPAPRGYRGVNTRLAAVACPSAALCFAVGQAVAFGVGNAPGSPLIERWNGRRWSLVHGPAADAPLTSVSCTSTRDCTAVGGFEHETGSANANNQQVEYPNVVEHWDGRSWSRGATAIPTGSGIVGGGLLGVSCTRPTRCLSVGSAYVGSPGYQPGNDGGGDQAITAPGNGTSFVASVLSFPRSVYRGPAATASPQTWLSAISCRTATSCAAVGGYTASNGAVGPLAATWNGISWAQIALRRGPVELASVSCPSAVWCMAVGSTIAERWVG